jgi:predicted transcriptional regulator
MIEPLTPAADLIRRAQEAGVKMKDICIKAKVAQSTPSRWKRGDYEPKVRTLRRMEAALEALVATKTACGSGQR